jgi:GTP-binding protein HflX
LGELDLGQKRSVVVLNKIDKASPETVEELVRKYDGIPVSALDKATFGPLLRAIEHHFWPEPSPERRAETAQDQAAPAMRDVI